MTIEESKKILEEVILSDGTLHSTLWYLDYDPGPSLDPEFGGGKACLDGEFTADQLEAIAIYMRTFTCKHLKQLS